MRRVTVLLLSLAAAPSSLAFLASSPRFHPAPRTGAAQCGIRRGPDRPGLRLTGVGAKGLRSVLSGADAPSKEQEGDKVHGEASGNQHGDAGQQVLWKDASPQRTVGNDQKSWMNQFPNTWQPAEALALDRSLRNGELAPKAHLSCTLSSLHRERTGHGPGSVGFLRFSLPPEGPFPHSWKQSTSRVPTPSNGATNQSK